MRIAIFDGILEHHVQDSLARALRARGHDVLSTGKIGHGFQFPRRGQSLLHLERALQAVFAFEPDWLLAMRPASLPPTLLQRVRKRGIRTVAWFSDDPVLFDLSYAPVLDAYDAVLHCGTEAVLSHYEQFFGRPTGVNFPFWTDHEAFPQVWGEEPPESRAMFLGNVQDTVRRKRYFDLAQFGDDIRIHGKVGSDYFHRSGGYLDTDAEVVAAGGRTDFAVNIPQWFRDHRGLETWFSGLDELGFFEFPSRVVQTMAMGIPTISIIEGGHRFTTYPEMLVAETVEEAAAIVRDPSWNRSALAELSRATVARFDRHFSATARAIALEHYLIDDGWKSLSAAERSTWFADVVEAEPKAPQATGRAEAITAAQPPKIYMPSKAVVVLPLESPAISTGAALVQALAVLHVPTEVVHCEESTFEAKLDEADWQALGVGDLLLVVDLSVKLPNRIGEQLNATSVLIADLQEVKTQTGKLAKSYDVVGVRSARAAERFVNAGFGNVLVAPRIVTPAFADAVQSRRNDGATDVVRIAPNNTRENVSAPGLAGFLDNAGVRLRTWDELIGLGIEELADALVSDVSVLVPEGSRTNPLLGDLFAHAVFAAGHAALPRAGAYADWLGLELACLQFGTPQELGRKLWRLDESARWRAQIDVATEQLHRSMSAREVLLDLMRPNVRSNTSGLQLRSSKPLLDFAASRSVGLTELGWTPRSLVSVTATALADGPVDLEIDVFYQSLSIWKGTVGEGVSLAIAAPARMGEDLSIQLRHHGPARVLTPELAYEIDVRVEGEALPAPLSTGSAPSVVEIRSQA